jgi:p-aminobenzoyl-glutamate transporter AbgT
MPRNGQSLINRGLGVIEWLGNKLPDPLFLFMGATVLVVVLSAVGTGLGWNVQPVRRWRRPLRSPGVGRPRVELVPYGEPIRARSLMTSDGAYWLTANMVRNFINFAPLGVVLVSMFGIGLAEKVGLFGAGMRQLAGITPSVLLTPTVILLGICSNIASDAGYIVLPALAGGLYAAAGRPALAGIAAAFAGVAGGFSANLLIASTDTLIAPLTEQGARVLDATYSVLPTCNWYFLAASVLVLVPVGWLVTAKITEPRLVASADGGGRGGELTPLTREERRGLKWALVGAAAAVALGRRSDLRPRGPAARGDARGGPHLRPDPGVRADARHCAAPEVVAGRCAADLCRVFAAGPGVWHGVRHDPKAEGCKRRADPLDAHDGAGDRGGVLRRSVHRVPEVHEAGHHDRPERGKGAGGGGLARPPSCSHR